MFNNYLASLYEDEMEKIAADSIVEELEEMGIDIDDLDEGQIEELAEMYAAGDEEGDEEGDLDLSQFDEEQLGALYEAGVIDDNDVASLMGEGEYEEGGEKEAMVKLAEADFLGRSMAHSFAEELEEIQKTAGKKKSAKSIMDIFRGGVRGGKKKRILKEAKGMESGYSKSMKGRKSMADQERGLAKGFNKSRAGFLKKRGNRKGTPSAADYLAGAKGVAKKRPGLAAGIGGGGLAALGLGGGYAAGQ